MTLTRDNHFVPQLYLKNFASAEGDVCEYRLLVSHSTVATWRSVHVAGTGYEKNLYTRIVHGEEADDIEQWLSREFETPVKEPLQKVLADKELTEGDWKALIRFLASQIVRTPAFLIKNLPLWNQMAPKVLDRSMKGIEAYLRQQNASDHKAIDDRSSHSEYFPIRTDRKDLPEEGKVQFTATMVVGRGLWFYSIKHMLTSTLEVLYKHKWTILEAPAGLGWFTSDDPVICLNFRSIADYDFNGGWGRAHANILFPLSPRHLMFAEIGANPYSRKIPSRYHARLFRRMIAEHAHRRIYSLAEDSKICQMKPRVVNAVAFQNERKLWETWYEDQSRAEQSL